MERDSMRQEPQHDRHEHVEEELEDLRKELEHFQKEKERVRAIVGKIGGVPKTQAKFVNILFVIVVFTSVVISIVAGQEWQLPMIEVATVALSVKIIYLIHSQMRIAHFEFWILSSLEWRVNEITKQLREIRQERETEGLSQVSVSPAVNTVCVPPSDPSARMSAPKTGLSADDSGPARSNAQFQR